MNSIIIKPGREKSVVHRHPWIFSGAVQSVNGDPRAGDIVIVRDYKGSFIAQAHYNPMSKICARVLELREDAVIDASWWNSMIRASVERRRGYSPGLKKTAGSAERLVFGEADFLPGLIADRYGKIVIIQALTAGVDKIKGEIAEIFNSILKPAAVFERSDAAVRALEGLPESSGIISGSIGALDTVINENGILYSIDPALGQKTGFFLDQRENRLLAASYAAGRSVLDCFCYSGGFTLSALKAGAVSAVSIDSSVEALDLLVKNLKLNNIPDGICTPVREDVFTYLRLLRDEGKRFGMVILDPPKFAPTRKDRDKAMRAYKDINLLAMKLLEPGGVLVTFSCSGGISSADLRMAVGWAGTDTLREVQCVRALAQAPDHPVRLSYPESEYLKGLICIVI